MTYQFKPSTINEAKAMSLEKTLENMEKIERYWFFKTKKLKGKDSKEAIDKLKDIRRGIQEVHAKANNAWNEVRKENTN